MRQLCQEMKDRAVTITNGYKLALDAAARLPINAGTPEAVIAAHMEFRSKQTLAMWVAHEAVLAIEYAMALLPEEFRADVLQFQCVQLEVVRILTSFIHLVLANDTKFHTNQEARPLLSPVPIFRRSIVVLAPSVIALEMSAAERLHIATHGCYGGMRAYVYSDQPVDLVHVRVVYFRGCSRVESRRSGG